ncbi:LuxR family transcriptional regulator [Maledivibacter halophilus]|uniref:Response regulator containing a CheY-like receiver domain and an HTH DNA-binding domain n=1 Tax=Maledivibacter halophilus TaxID=36842 RepID=A0A1T5LYJ6_9FIRM|nr:LuxR family transcriptional regulator [Maledivibacter halophilus]SKC81070.1 Response regulator containing a CheY-like receiver domain and an HTH DNA-binding domain [Maledivibacter halophilus]
MIKSYINIFKIYPFIILTLGFTYGATIVFTFFGPVLTITVGKLTPTLSIIGVLVHVFSFFLKPTELEKNQKFFYVFLGIVIPLILLFYTLPYYFQILTIMLYAYMIGRIGCFWTYMANAVIPSHIRGRTISLSLFISFVILFLLNISFPLLTNRVALIFPGVISIIVVVFYSKINRNHKNNVVSYKNKAYSNIHSYYIYAFLIVIYIAGGFSYAGIYPSFEPYMHIDRYYNVLFYLLAIITAGIVLDKYGRKINFMLGVGFLGISFTFFIMPSSVITYFITQTFLQCGWAFVNAFGWSFSWDMSESLKKNYVFPRGIAAMLLGTAIGAFLSQTIEKIGFGHSSVYGIVTFIPLFLAIMILVFFPETLKRDKRRKIEFNKLQGIEELKILTPRELEVCYHVINGFNNKRISKILFISENTVKTHISRIYSKLYISSRSELTSYIYEIIQYHP